MTRNDDLKGLGRIKEARKASAVLPRLSGEDTARILNRVADALVARSAEILKANEKDLEKMPQDSPDYDRLRLTEERIAGIASDMRNVAGLPVPYGKVISETVRPNGMVIKKVSVPFGVIGVIYEARPNVTADVFGLCFRAGSACVLKGGHDADSSSRAIVDVIHSVLREEGLPEALCTLMPGDRESAATMMQAVGEIDVIIPRGGRGLIDFVRDNSKVPVIETGAGVCHTYVDASADLEKTKAVVLNAKTRRVSVCNALDCLLVHRSRVGDLDEILAPLKEKNVEIYTDPAYYGTEFRDYKIAVKVVDSLDEALEHIARYGSHHSECIMSEDPEAIAKFQREVDAACVYANVSTAFTDGGQFGFGAEIGISTQKLYARGPMALPEITTYKYLITGDGQTRS